MPTFMAEVRIEVEVPFSAANEEDSWSIAENDIVPKIEDTLSDLEIPAFKGQIVVIRVVVDDIKAGL